MTLQVLVSTMNQNDYKLLDDMNISTDAIVINQCDKNMIEKFEYKKHCVKWLSLSERGIGLSRNTALMRADGDILLFADDDVRYSDNYGHKVIAFFENHPDVDVAVFNFQSLNPQRPEFVNIKERRLNLFNCLKYGAIRIAVRKNAVLTSNVNFSLMFGGGAPYQAGEDNLFLTNCIQKKLKVVASNIMLGTVKQETSTWFKGYNEGYYFDRGALFAAMYGKWAFLFLVLIELKSIHKKHTVSFGNRLSNGLKGIKSFKQR